MLAKTASLGNEYLSGMLSDSDIRHFWNNGINIFTSEDGELAFDIDKQLQYGSIDLRFRHEYTRIKLKKDDVLTYKRLKDHDYTTPFELKNGEKLVIEPGEIIFTTTLETIQLSKDFAGIVTGRSSFARLGIMVHCCAEYINPGHGQPIPLQLVNLGPCKVELDLNTPVCQLVLFKLRTPASGSYKHGKRSKYSSEVGPQGSKIYEEINPNENLESGKKTDRKGKTKNILEKYLLPFLPSLIMLLGVTPFIAGNITGKSIADIFSLVQGMPVTILLFSILLGVYIWLKRGSKK